MHADKYILESPNGMSAQKGSLYTCTEIRVQFQLLVTKEEILECVPMAPKYLCIMV